MGPGDAPWNALTPEQRQELHDALLDAFDIGGLTELVRYHLTHRLDVLVNTAASLDTIVFNLLEALDQRGELEPLLRGAVQRGRITRGCWQSAAALPRRRSRRSTRRGWCAR